MGNTVNRVGAACLLAALAVGGCQDDNHRLDALSDRAARLEAEVATGSALGDEVAARKQGDADALAAASAWTKDFVGAELVKVREGAVADALAGAARYTDQQIAKLPMAFKGDKGDRGEPGQKGDPGPPGSPGAPGGGAFWVGPGGTKLGSVIDVTDGIALYKTFVVSLVTTATVVYDGANCAGQPSIVSSTLPPGSWTRLPSARVIGSNGTLWKISGKSAIKTPVSTLVGQQCAAWAGGSDSVVPIVDEQVGAPAGLSWADLDVQPL